MTIYLDTSIVLRVLFRDPNAWPEWGQWTSAYASCLWEVEARRCVDRARLQGALNDDQVAQLRSQIDMLNAHLNISMITSSVLARAGDAFPTAIGTLDAIHLATAILVRDHTPLDAFLTHDRQLATAAIATGFAVRGV